MTIPNHIFTMIFQILDYFWVYSILKNLAFCEIFSSLRRLTRGQFNSFDNDVILKIWLSSSWPRLLLWPNPFLPAHILGRDTPPTQKSTMFSQIHWWHQEKASLWAAKSNLIEIEIGRFLDMKKLDFWDLKLLRRSSKELQKLRFLSI